jgi:hypothetical protein
MNKKQSYHIGMLNSYNLLVEDASIEEIIHSGLGVFAHVPDEEPDHETIVEMIHYFQEHEMFELCSNLIKYIEENFNEDGTYKIGDCECTYPSISAYTKRMKCASCKKRLRK